MAKVTDHSLEFWERMRQRVWKDGVPTKGPLIEALRQATEEQWKDSDPKAWEAYLLTVRALLADSKPIVPIEMEAFFRESEKQPPITVKSIVTPEKKVPHGVSCE